MIQDWDDLEATAIHLTDEGRARLESLVRSPKTEQRLAERARIVLLAAEGRSTRSIAQGLGTWPGRVSRWRIRYAERGLEGLSDRPRPGPAPRYGPATEGRVLGPLAVLTHIPCQFD